MFFGDQGQMLENGRAVLDGAAEALRGRDDVKALYLGGDPVPAREEVA